MKIIARSILRRFADSLTRAEDYKAVRAALAAWYREALRANWKNQADVRKHYSNPRILGRDRVVFNIEGNDYRLVVAIDYVRHTVFVKWFGSQTDYDKIDVKTGRYER